MGIGLIILLILLAVIGFFVFYGVGIYNRLVKLKVLVEEAWSGIDVQLKKRHDLIPNLVETVKGYATHEQETFTQVTEARAKATQMNVNASDLTEESIREYQQAQGELSQALGRLLLIQENYPELKANQNFLALQDELAGTENRISVERNKFNQTAQDFNSYIRQFPRVIYAGWFGFKPKGYFQSAPGAETAPRVQF